MRYSQHPSVHYLPVSDNEVIVKGSHLEGFSLLVSDDSNRGLARRVIDSLSSDASTEEVHRNVASDRDDVTEDDISSFLEELAHSGAILRHGERANRVPEWISFLRFGHVDASAQRHSLTIAGGQVAADVAAAVRDLGLAADHVESIDPGELSRYAVPDVSMNVAERIGMQPEATFTETDLPDDELPRLVVVVEGAPLRYLYDLNQAAVEAGTPILYCQVAGSDFAVGPYVVPGATACFWEFERQRARSMFSYGEYAVLAATGGALATPTVTARAAEAAIVPSLVELALLGRSMLAGQLVRGRATTAETSRHAIMRLPRCPTCLATRPMLRNQLF